MVCILDGSSEHVAHACRKIGLFGGGTICDSFESIKCLDQIQYNIVFEQKRLLLTSKLPSYISTMMLSQEISTEKHL